MDEETEFELEDARTSLDVSFQLGEAINENTCKARIIRNRKKEDRVWAVRYENREKAESIEFLLRKFRHENFCNSFLLDPDKEQPILLIEEGFELFDDWVKKESPIWEYNMYTTKVLAMGIAFVSVFKGVIGGLRVLHYNNKYHGNLLKGVTVSGDYKVKLFNFSFDKAFDINAGIEKDIDDLYVLVRDVLSNHPPINGLAEPDCVLLFRAFELMIRDVAIDKRTDFTKAKFRAYYTYHNPIFGDGDDRHKLTNKLLQLENLYGEKMKLEEIITLDEPPTSMRDWYLRIKSNTVLFDKFYFSSDKVQQYQRKPRNIIYFYKSTHHTDEDQVVRRTDGAIEAMLNETFPDFLPKMYYEFVNRVACQYSRRVNWSFRKFFQSHVPKFE